jgi:hypothetical protein
MNRKLVMSALVLMMGFALTASAAGGRHTKDQAQQGSQLPSEFAERCVVNRPRPDKGQTATWTMVVVNDGAACEISQLFSGSEATSVMVHKEPQNGVLAVETSTIRYVPRAAFSGMDEFEVQWFGMPWGPYSPANKKTSVRAKVDVTVVNQDSQRQ